MQVDRSLLKQAVEAINSEGGDGEFIAGEVQGFLRSQEARAAHVSPEKRTEQILHLKKRIDRLQFNPHSKLRPIYEQEDLPHLLEEHGRQGTMYFDEKTGNVIHGPDPEEGSRDELCRLLFLLGELLPPHVGKWALLADLVRAYGVPVGGPSGDRWVPEHALGRVVGVFVEKAIAGVTTAQRQQGKITRRRLETKFRCRFPLFSGEKNRTRREKLQAKFGRDLFLLKFEQRHSKTPV